MISAPHHDHDSSNDLADVQVEREARHAQQRSSTVNSENGDPTGLNKKKLSSSPSDLEALSISISPSVGGNGNTPTLNNGERDAILGAQDAKEDQEEDIGLAHTQTSTPQLFLQPLSRRKSSIPHPPASPTFPPMPNGHAHQTPTWHPRSSLAEQGHPSGTISPASRSTTPAIATTAAATTHQQNYHLHYEYQESPRSPLAWRQTFGEAVRLNTGGGGAVSPALPHTPTPAPAPEGRSSRSSRQGSVNTPPAEGYFAFTGGRSREGSLGGIGDDEPGQVSSPGNVANRTDHVSTPVGWEGDRVVVAFGPVPTRDVGSSGGAAGISGAVSPCRHERGVDPSRVLEEETKLHGLGFDTPLSRLASPSPFESVSLNSSESERSDHEEEQHDGQGQLSPLPPSSARSRSFNTRSSLGSLNAAEHEPTTPRQRQSSSRRVSTASLSTTTTPQRGITKSPGPRRVSAGGGLWGTIETENTTRETSMSPRRRENGTRSPFHGSVEGANDDTRSMTGTMKSVSLSRDASTGSRRASAAFVVPASNGASPTTVATPRLQAPPAVPHDLDPALLVKLSKAGASSMALWAAKGDPAAATAARIAGEGSEKKRLSMRTSGDAVRASMASERTAVSMPGTPPMLSDIGGGGGMNQRVSGPTHQAFGPSKLDQVRSQTRMVHLPPKSREEDAVHLERWKEMMEQSRLADEKRQAEREQRRLDMEKRLAADMPIWETEILNPAFADAHTGGDAWSLRIRGNPKLRDLWFRGVPSHLRGRAWSLAIGNDLTLSKDSFRQYQSRARKAIQSERFPQDVLDAIEHDTSETLRVIKLFQAGSPMHDELKDLLHAWYVSRLDEGLGYASDVHHLAGMLLMTMNLPMAFIALRNLLNRPCLRAFYSGITDEVEAYYRIFENLQGELFPKIYANCKHLGVRLPSSYFTTVFIHQLSFEAAARVWDVILLEGDSHIFRIALAILAILEPRLYFPDRKEVVSVLEGSNPASLAIVARERERAKQKGLPFVADIDGVLTSLGVTEDAIFDTLQHDDWKESRFNRLCQRELPDD